MSKSTTQQKLNWPRHEKILIALLIIIPVLLITYFTVLHFQSKDRAHNAIEQAVNEIVDELPGELTYNDIQDRGCNFRMVNFGYAVNCSYTGVIYKKYNDNLEQTVEDMRNTLTKQGYVAGHVYSRDGVFVVPNFREESIKERLDDFGATIDWNNLAEDEFIYGLNFTARYKAQPSWLAPSR